MFWAFENKGILGVFATHEEASRDQFRAQISLFLATLPKPFKVGEEVNNRTMLVLNNASLFRYLVAGQRKRLRTVNQRDWAGRTAEQLAPAVYGTRERLPQARPVT